MKPNFIKLHRKLDNSILVFAADQIAAVLPFNDGGSVIITETKSLLSAENSCVNENPEKVFNLLTIDK